MILDAATAVQRAAALRDVQGVPPHYVVDGAERRIIEVCEGSPGPAALVRDVRVWIVCFRAGVAWLEMAIDEASGDAVRMERSST